MSRIRRRKPHRATKITIIKTIKGKKIKMPQTTSSTRCKENEELPFDKRNGNCIIPEIKRVSRFSFGAFSNTGMKAP